MKDQGRKGKGGRAREEGKGRGRVGRGSEVGELSRMNMGIDNLWDLYNNKSVVRNI